MAPTPVPTPLPPWNTALWQIDPYPVTAFRGLLDHVGSMQPLTGGEWRHVQVRFSYTGSTDTADDAYCNFDFAKVTAGAIDANWLDSDYATVETAIGTALATWTTSMTPQWDADLFKWYRRAFNPYGTMIGDPPRLQVFAPGGPPVRLTPMTHVGTIAGSVATQTSLSITERTAFPSNWGRFYLPGLAPAALIASGHVSPTVTDGIGGAFRTAYNTTMAIGLFPVVPTTRVGGKPASDRTGDAYGLLTLDHVQVDDVPDVIRRRRLRNPIHRYLSA